MMTESSGLGRSLSLFNEVRGRKAEAHRVLPPLSSLSSPPLVSAQEDQVSLLPLI